MKNILRIPDPCGRTGRAFLQTCVAGMNGEYLFDSVRKIACLTSL